MPIPAILGTFVGGAAVGAIIRGLVTRFLPALLYGLRSFAGSILGHAMFSMGLYFFIAEPAGDVLLGEMQERFNFVSGTVSETLYYLNVDDFCAMVLSAFLIRSAWQVQLRGRPGKAKPTP